MKLRIANRAIAVAVMAIVLAAVLTVSALAYGVDIAGNVTGLDSNVTYTYAQYDFATDSYGTFNPLTSTTTLTTGVWGIKAGDAAPEVLYIQGAETGKINYLDAKGLGYASGTYQAYNNEKVAAILDTGADIQDLIPGKWTLSGMGNGSGIYRTGTNAFPKVYHNGTTMASVYYQLAKERIADKVTEAGVTYWKAKANSDDILQATSIYYGFTNSQVVPAASYEGFTSFGNLNINGTVKTNMTPRITYYVKNPGSSTANEYYYNVSGWQLGTPITLGVPANMPETGYIVGFRIQWFYNFTVQNFLDIVTNATSGTTIADATTQSHDGHLYLKNDNTNAVSVTASDVTYPAPATFTIENGELKGFVAGKYYQYANVSVGNGVVFEYGTPKALTEATEPKGLFAIRETNATATVYSEWTDLFFIDGGDHVVYNQINGTEKAGTDANGDGTAGGSAKVVEIQALADNADNRATIQFTSGKWMGIGVTNYNICLNYPQWYNQYRVGTTGQFAKTKDGFNGYYYTYKFAPEEVIPMESFGSYKFNLYFRQGANAFDGSVVTKVTFVVINEEGVLEQRTVTKNITLNSNGTLPTNVEHVVSATDFAKTDGYIVGIIINPYYLTDGTTLTSTGSTNPSCCLDMFADSWVVKGPAEAPEFSVALNDTQTAIEVTVTNASAAANYKWKKADATEWNVLEAGVRSFTVTELGDYVVEAYGEMLIGTAQATCTVEALTPTAPTASSTPNSPDTFKVSIDNPSTLYTYEYNNGGNWTALVDYAFTAAAGTYEVRTSGELFDGYAVANITVAPIAATAPTASSTPGSNGIFTITIKNYSDLYSYKYQLAGATEWTNIPAGEDTFTVNAEGEYVLAAGGSAYTADATVTVKVVDVPDAVRNITVTEKTVSLDATKSYEYTTVTIDGIGTEWTAIPAGESYTFTDAGLYAIRLAASGTEEASAFQVFLIEGDKIHTILHTEDVVGTASTYNGVTISVPVINSADFNTYRDETVFTVGKWTGYGISHNLQKGNGWDPLTIGSTGSYGHTEFAAVYALGEEAQTNQTPAFRAAIADLKTVFEDYKYTYAYTNDEIIPVEKFESFKFAIRNRIDNFDATGTVQTKLTFVVMNAYGEIEYRDVYKAAENFKGCDQTFTAEDYTDAGYGTDGYLIGLVVIPYVAAEDANVTITNFAKTNNLYQASIILYEDGYKVTLPKLDKPVLNFNEETKLVEGFDELLAYYYAPLTVAGYGDKSYFDSKLTLELEAGLWAIGVRSEDPAFADSDPFIVFVKGDEEARMELGTRLDSGANAGFYQIVRGDVWEQGKWSGVDLAHAGSGWGDTASRNLLSATGGHVAATIYTKPLKDAIENADAVAEAAARQAIADKAETVQFKYAYENNEVIPADEIVTFSFKSQKRLGTIDFGAGLTAKVTFFVVNSDGEIEEYVWTEATSVATTKHTVDFTVDAGWENGRPTEGWVVALEINPWTSVVPENISLNTADFDRYPDGLNTIAQIIVDEYTIKLAAGLPDVVGMAAPANGYGEITGLNPLMEYELATYDEGTGTYSEFVAIPAGISSFQLAEGKYLIRVAESKYFTSSDSVPVEITTLGEFVSLENEVKKIHLPNDFVEVTADYEIDVTKNTWVASLALDNMKTVAPESTVIILGDGYKFVLKASDFTTDKLNHYYNFAISFDGESRHDGKYESLKELAGEQYITEFFIESPVVLPFENAQLYIAIDEEYEGQSVELRSYNERINKLRGEEETMVEDGWAIFTVFENTYVILGPEE